MQGPSPSLVFFRNRFSGVTEEDLKGVEIKLKDVHKKLLRKFGADTILIGHSLESDLRALKVCIKIFCVNLLMLSTNCKVC